MHPAEIARTAPDKIAVQLGEATRTYSELDTKSETIAALMSHLGLSTGDVMAIWAGNHIDFLTCAWAGQRSGLYYLPVAASLTGPEAAYILADSGAKALIVDRAHADQIDSVIKADPTLSTLKVFCLDAGTALDHLWRAADRAQQARAVAPALEGGDMLYTSGTTGRPKGVRQPLNLAPLGSNTRRVERLRDLFDMTADTVFLSPAPLYHAAPLRFTMTVLRLGGTVVLLERFTADTALRAIMDTGATHTQWVPTMFSRMLALPEKVRRSFHAPRHVKAIHAGAPCPEDVKRRMIDWFGPILHEYYSGTESIGFTHIDSPDWLKRPGSVGRPWGCNIHILDEDGNELTAGETGLVYFEGKGKLQYHNASEKTRNAHNEEGWATMGDIGHVDEDGFLFLTDRRAFTIVSGGVNVYPREVEEVLIAHPDVLDAAVFGVPDPDFGEAVQAVVQPLNVADPEQLALDLFDEIAGKLAPFKRPKRIAFTDALPLTDSGKIQKRVLQDQYSDPATRGHSPKKVAA